MDGSGSCDACELQERQQWQKHQHQRQQQRQQAWGTAVSAVTPLAEAKAVDAGSTGIQMTTET